jgi:deazaflavin-dependent oxidoreductase (nitroreductase family)
MKETNGWVPEVDPFQAKSPVARAAERLAQLRPITWFLVHVGNKVDPILMHLSDGRVNTTGTDAVVVLHHIGAKTGTARQTPLVYFTEGRDVILIASNGGAPRHPAWLHNIRANPDVELWVGKRGGAYRARVATPEERAVLWPKANALYAGYEGYQVLAGDREIPVVICSRRGAEH